MLRFTKETDLERVKRLRKSIIDGYIENESSTDLLVSKADLKFMLEKAEEQVGFEVESSNQVDEGYDGSSISTIPTDFGSSMEEQTNDPF